MMNPATIKIRPDLSVEASANNLMNTHDRAELARKTLDARGRLYELIVQFRTSAATTEDSRAQALFEFSAEMLAGMARAFRTLEDDLTSHN